MYFKASIVSLSEEIYYTDEPSSSDASVIKPLTVIRTGDLSRTTEVRISTSDDTAIGGLDFKPRTERVFCNRRKNSSRGLNESSFIFGPKNKNIF